MKTMAALVLGMCALAASTDDKRGDPEGMTCRDVVIVRYVNGPKADEFSTRVADHLEFLRKGLHSGDILFAGPLRDGPGGYTVYGLTDKKKVEKLVQQDPLIANKVCTYEMNTWMMCKTAPADGK